MNLDAIIYHLKTTNSRQNFDAWVDANLEELTDYFYGLSDEELLEIRFDSDFYFGTFTQSVIFKEFEVSRNYSEPFTAFLFLLSTAAERMAENFGIVAPIEHLLSYLPDSGVKYRLQALTEIQNIDDTKKDYIRLFPTVLNLLVLSESFQEENHTQEITSFLIYYYNKAQKKLAEKNYTDEVNHLKQLFSDDTNLNSFHFLGHFDIQELVRGRYAHELKVEIFPTPILYPSVIMESHFKYNINYPVLNHPKSLGRETIMGYDKRTVINDVLVRGRTSFDVAFRDLTPDDKVLLYCYFNMKKHFFTSVAVYKKLWNSLSNILSQGKYTPVFIDLGCGPLTSGLAFGELCYQEFNQQLRFSYVGIDISNAMIRKAKEFTEVELFDGDSKFLFYNNWNEIGEDTLVELAGQNNPIILNASYLFANLNESAVNDLAVFVMKLVEKYKNVHFIFQNPDRADRNINWEIFKAGVQIKNNQQGVEAVFYKASRSLSREPGSENVLYEILSFIS